MSVPPSSFFFTNTASTEIYTLSLHDALPISPKRIVIRLRYSSIVFGTVSGTVRVVIRSEEHTSELQSHSDLVCRLLLEKKKVRNPTAVPPGPDHRRTGISGRPSDPLGRLRQP